MSKYWFYIFFLTIISVNTYAQDSSNETKTKLSPEEVLARCSKLSIDKKEKYKNVCDKAAKLVQAKKNNSTSTENKEKKNVNYEKIYNACLKLSPEKKEKHKVTCAKAAKWKKQQSSAKKEDNILLIEPGTDPLFKKVEAVNGYSLYLGYSGILGSIKGFEVDLEKRSSHLGYGLFYTNQTINDQTQEGWIKGSAYGAALRYHFYPLNYTRSKTIFDPSLYMKVGMASLESTYQGKLPTYIYTEVGLEASYPILRTGLGPISGYGKVGTSHIYHSDSNFLHLGSSFSLGIKFDF